MKPQMSDHAFSQPRRPPVVTILCILGFIGAVLVVPSALSAAAREVGPWYPSYLFFVGLSGLVCNIGFWKMRKWGLYLYLAVTAFNQVVMLNTGNWQPMTLIAPAIVIGIIAYYFNRMV